MSELFDTAALYVPPPEHENKELSVDRRRTLKRAALIESGIHPATKAPLAGTPETCGSCSQATKHGNYWKCELAGTSFSAATDIRVSWPACTKWKWSGQ